MSRRQKRVPEEKAQPQGIQGCRPGILECGGNKAVATLIKGRMRLARSMQLRTVFENEEDLEEGEEPGQGRWRSKLAKNGEQGKA